MDLIKIICGMLAVALFLGFLTCGSHNDRAAVGEELENNIISEPASGVAREVRASEENTTQDTAGESKNEERASMKPAPPNSAILAQGGSKMSTQRREIESKVRATVRLFESQGEGLFPKLVETGSPWNSSDFNVFVWTVNGTQVACTQEWGREGEEMKGLLDADGKPIGELFIETAQSINGEGWIDYYWKESGNSATSHMLAFVKKATYGGQAYIVGSSFYVDEEIICKNLSDCKYKEEQGNINVAQLLNVKNLNKDIDLNYSVAHSILEPGENIVPHMVKNPEVLYILEGEGIIYIDGVPVELHNDQIVYIPAGAIQTTYNTGKNTLKFLAIDQPGWSQENTVVFG